MARNRGRLSTLVLAAAVAAGGTASGGGAVEAASASADFVTGAGAGGAPHVKVFDGSTGALVQSFLAYDPSFAGGVRVAAGDVDGDGLADLVTGTGPGSAAHVKVFSGATGSLLRSFLAYDAAFTGGAFVAAGDVNGDGYDDVATGADAGATPQVKVFSGSTGEVLLSFFAYDPSYTGGVRVAVGDINGDGSFDIVTGTRARSAAHVKVFSGADLSVLASFFAYDPRSPAASSLPQGMLTATGETTSSPAPAQAPPRTSRSSTEPTSACSLVLRIRPELRRRSPRGRG